MSAAAYETEPAHAITPAAGTLALPGWRRAILFGTGFGIAISDRNLEVAVVRARPSGATPVAAIAIADFRNRPAAEWGSELSRFLAAAREGRLAATILLPRDEIIVRTLSLPGVSDKDAPAAIELQIDTLHPWGDVDISWGWSRVGGNSDFLVGLARKETVEAYETLFAEAGIPVAALTFSPTVIHAALRIWAPTPASILCYQTDSRARTEVYGESPSRPVFSAEFSIPPERALALARAELRLPQNHPANLLSEVLPKPAGGPIAASTQAYAAAIAGAGGRAVRFANLLPPERRASHNRLSYLASALIVAFLLLALLTVLVILPAIDQKRYRSDLDRAARQLEPTVVRAQSLEKRINADRARLAALDEIRRRPQADLDVLAELTRLLPPPVWTSSVEIYPDSVVITGEADQAAPLLKTLDSSSLFENSQFMLSVTRSGQAEQFRIKTMRRGRAGRTTP